MTKGAPPGGARLLEAPQASAAQPAPPAAAQGSGRGRAHARGRRPPGWLGPVGILAVVVLANLPALVGLVDANPLDSFSGLGVSHAGQIVPGVATIDLNAGATSQALGHRAALDWLHGHVPWWNPDEGVGTPLAAEMQSAAFFPPTLLLAWSDGQLLERMLLEAAAGLFTYALSRRLRLGRLAATVGGVLFALNGTFAWYQHAAVNPICLLPACLLGVELARDRTLGDWRLLLLPAAVALSIVAGFPETAYLDAGLVALWALVRIGQDRHRLRLAGRIALLGGAGAALAAPLALAFGSYLRNGSVGAHTSMATVHLPTANLATLALPYLTGPLKAFGAEGDPSLGHLFIANSGYLGLGVVALGLVGLVVPGWRREGAIRAALAGWVLVWLLRLYGVLPLERLVAAIPGLGQAAVFRAAFPSIELAMILLASFGLEAAVERPASRPRPAGIVLAAGAVVAGLALGPGKPLLQAVLANPGAAGYVTAAAVWGGAVLAVLVAGCLVARRGLAAGLLGGILVLDALMSFAYPELAGPRAVAVDLGPVSYLQAHLGNGRFFSLEGSPTVVRAGTGGPITPNYGTYFGLASANYLDIPDPARYVAYVHGIDPWAGEEFFTGSGFGRLRGGPPPLTEVAAHVSALEAIGVSYLVAGPHVPVGRAIPSARLVWSDQLAAIWHLPGAAPYAWATGCRVRVVDPDTVTAACARPARLVRSELSFPGWTATVNGRAALLGRSGPLFQSVALPAGTSTVRFSYGPSLLGELLALAAAVVLLVPVGLRALRRR